MKLLEHVKIHDVLIDELLQYFLTEGHFTSRKADYIYIRWNISDTQLQTVVVPAKWADCSLAFPDEKRAVSRSCCHFPHSDFSFCVSRGKAEWRLWIDSKSWYEVIVKLESNWVSHIWLPHFYCPVKWSGKMKIDKFRVLFDVCELFFIDVIFEKSSKIKSSNLGNWSIVKFGIKRPLLKRVGS